MSDPVGRVESRLNAQDAQSGASEKGPGTMGTCTCFWWSSPLCDHGVENSGRPGTGEFGAFLAEISKGALKFRTWTCSAKKISGPAAKAPGPKGSGPASRRCRGYSSSTLMTSRFRKTGGPSHSAASRAANAVVTGRREFAIASSYEPNSTIWT